jgi:rubrerythrin
LVLREVYVLEDLLNTLIQLEVKGFELYEEYKNNAEDSTLKELFGELAVAEKIHELFYKGVKEKVLSSEIESVEEEYKEYIRILVENNFFLTNTDFSVKTISEALNIAERLEKDTIIFMNELNAIINEREGFKAILEEEKRHLLRIYQYKKEHGVA